MCLHSARKKGHGVILNQRSSETIPTSKKDMSTADYLQHKHHLIRKGTSNL